MDGNRNFAKMGSLLHRFTSVFFYTDDILILLWNKALSSYFIEDYFFGCTRVESALWQSIYSTAVL